jgi:hypothetical protein
MAWAEGPIIIRVGRRAFFLAQHKMQVMVFALAVFVLVLTRLDLFGRLRDLRCAKRSQEDREE